MQALAQPVPSLRRLDGLSCHVAGELTAVEPAWRILEAEGLATPYQRFDWVKSWRAVQDPAGARPFVVWSVCAGDGSPLLMLPLEIEQRGPVRVARLPGGRQANFSAPLMDRTFARVLTGDIASRLLQDFAALDGSADVLAVVNQPDDIDGIPNPFAAMPGAAACSEPVTMTELVPGADPIVRLMSRDTRKKFVRKRRGLGEVAPLRSGIAGDPAEAEALLAAFLRLRAERAAQRGVANPFARPILQRFLAEAIQRPANASAPVLELHALWCGDRVASVFGAVVIGGWMSGSILAHDIEMARYSPGELLLLEVVAAAWSRGLTRFDLGVGSSVYKARFCPDPMPLRDVHLPLTRLGQAVAPLLAAARRIKASIKREPHLMALVRQVEPLLPARI